MQPDIEALQPVCFALTHVAANWERNTTVVAASIAALFGKGQNLRLYKPLPPFPFPHHARWIAAKSDNRRAPMQI